MSHKSYTLKGAQSVIHSYQTTLRILATSDLHMHLRGFNYTANTPNRHAGLARISTVIANARADLHTGLSLLFDNGDALQGTALADTLRDQPFDHPMANAFNALEYDAIGLGNHDFDFGLDFFSRVAAQYAAPVVCSNLHNTTHLRDTGLDMILPWAMLHREIPCIDARLRPLSIGVLSVLPTKTLQWNHGKFPQTTEITPMIEAAKTGSAHLKSLGADIVVLLAHSGIGVMQGGDDTENSALQMGAIEDIDAIIAGHSHGVFPDPNPEAPAQDGVDHAAGTLLGTPAVMPGAAGSHLAQIDLHLDYTPQGWRIAEQTSEAIPALNVPENVTVRKLSRTVHGKTLARMATSVGMINAPVHSCFSLLKTSPEMELLADAMTQSIERAAKGTEYQNLPIVCAVAAGTSGGRAGPSNYLAIPAGPIQYRHILQLCPFEDQVWAVDMSGADICDWLERSAAIFTTLDPNNPDQDIIRSGAPRFNFDAILGLSYTIDPTQPAKYQLNGDVINAAAARVKNVAYKGAPIDKDARFLVASTSYRIAGGGRFPNLTVDQSTLRSGSTVQDALLDFVKSPSTPKPNGHWQIKTTHPTSAVFETTPDAVAYLPEIQEFSPENLGITDRGFLRLRLHF
ncbi:5'-nucleotidase C-terminal domain-containing protein [Pseudosulfitobacter sp. SM2401]|uniref:5'-nucleotidase C-terminal domain-containing protein n=1 Tax=Pseudosulfitobacter sp. SM2401 TaxID=3350098 RepID=UPI0036F1A723